nr:DUF4158 domain-containing protein [Paraburkholderia nodosa]
MFLPLRCVLNPKIIAANWLLKTGTGVTALPDFLRYTGQPIRDPEFGMATIESTAYPRFPKVFSPEELQAFYSPDVEELEWVRRNARGQSSRLGLLVLLKAFQQMHYFPFVDAIPPAVIEHIRASANIGAEAAFGYNRARSPVLFRHYAAIREFLCIQPYYNSDTKGAIRRRLTDFFQIRKLVSRISCAGTLKLREASNATPLTRYLLKLAQLGGYGSSQCPAARKHRDLERFAKTHRYTTRL